MVGSTISDTNFDNFNTICIKLLCGGVAGSISKTLIAPLERAKILFQVKSKHYPYTGIFSTLAKIVQREGFFGLYNGNMSSIVRVFPYAAIQFVSFDFFQKLFCPDKSSISLTGNFVAGALAGATSVIFTYPLDVTRARLAVQFSTGGPKQYSGLYQAFTHMWKNEGGLKALYRGVGPTMVGIFPYAGINFFTYHTLKWYYLNKWSDKKDISTITRLFFGSCAGILGQTTVYPLDVVRRRMQIDGVVHGKTTFTYQYKNSFDALKTIYTKEGFRMLFRGLHINYIKVVPLVSVSFTINDILRKQFGIKNH